MKKYRKWSNEENRLTPTDDFIGEPFTSNIDSRLGPHQDRERNLMIGKLKPLAAFIEPVDFINYWINCIKENNLITYCHFECAITGKPYKSYFIAQEDQEWRIRSFINTLTRYTSGKMNKAIFHARCGLLLGYTKDEIRTFLRY